MIKIEGQAVFEIKIGNNRFQYEIIFIKQEKIEGNLGIGFLKLLNWKSV